MSTAQRKARKRAGIRFEKPAKVGTPLAERQHVVQAEWDSLEKAYQRGEVSKNEYQKAGRAIDSGRGWRSAVPRIARNVRRNGRGNR